MEVLNETTGITVGLAVVIFGGLLGFVKWLTTIHNLARSNKETIETLQKSHQDSMNHVEIRLKAVEVEMGSTSRGIVRVETKLDMLLERLNK